ncbi:GlxA family transcriptional regulator [Thalassovita aquimarina]|uniref:Helix-turn-helix domain-containing protein n=1 Tax=Thalassovita aquimarina TaxID=2785917 RepID=A0ABS5HWM7_9RHOB|nr:helix-turn-helix domain-containing protein [Thalassovita aquimarina]MBR9653294.1 helix-turn-helix domain-containing protein [Thalassovita aquimarina]
MTPNLPIHLTFVLFDGFSNMVLANAVEPLRAARNLSGRNLFEWQIATIDGAPARSSSGLQLQADKALSEADTNTGMLVLVAGYGAREHAAKSQVRAAIREAARRAETVIGLDMGAWIMACNGLLHGRRATVHWHEFDAFEEEFHHVEAVSDGHVIQGDRMSAGTATSAMSLILEVIRANAGDALAYDVSTLFRYDSAEKQRTASSALSPRLGRAVREMLRHIEDPKPLADIAGWAGVSLRTMDRMFQRELGVTAGEYYRSVRLARAQNLASATSLPVHAIAAQTGFASAATLSRAFRRHFGQTLMDTRRNAQRDTPF